MKKLIASLLVVGFFVGVAGAVSAPATPVQSVSYCITTTGASNACPADSSPTGMAKIVSTTSVSGVVSDVRYSPPLSKSQLTAQQTALSNQATVIGNQQTAVTSAIADSGLTK